MSVKIRLTRTGKKHQGSYRIVSQDTHFKRDGKFLEILGHWNPHLKPPEDVKVKTDRVNFWISKGAKPTLTVSKLLEMQNAKGQTTKAGAQNHALNVKR